MPLYEYRCEQDGELISLLRSMSDADKPVDDPKGKGRTFSRVLSTFAVKGGASPNGAPASSHTHSASCGCGKPMGSCGMPN